MNIHGKITARDGATITVVLTCNDPLMRMPEPGMEISGTAQRPQVTLPRAVLEAFVAGEMTAEDLAVAKTALAIAGELTSGTGITQAELLRGAGYSFLPDAPEPDAALTPPVPAEPEPPPQPPSRSARAKRMQP